ncbi:MAG TPA: twin-arginine translocase TatA/TatE family subunit, partial [Kofleriaceae bacterium]|nr:twin-arginine translocase TatA/TatE family subunit [Kofleriaceae bacterium]
MFGMGMSEILVILLVAALFLGPEKLPDAATKISKGIRDLRKQTKDLQDTIENDTELGGAIRDLKSALRGDEIRRPPVRKPPAKAAAAKAAAA